MAADRKLVVTENMTVDGVIDTTEGWFSAGRRRDRRHGKYQRRLEADRGRTGGRVPPLRLPDDYRARAAPVRPAHLSSRLTPSGVPNTGQAMGPPTRVR